MPSRDGPRHCGQSAAAHVAAMAKSASSKIARLVFIACWSDRSGSASRGNVGSWKVQHTAEILELPGNLPLCRCNSGFSSCGSSCERLFCVVVSDTAQARESIHGRDDEHEL